MENNYNSLLFQGGCNDRNKQFNFQHFKFPFLILLVVRKIYLICNLFYLSVWNCLFSKFKCSYLLFLVHSVWYQCISVWRYLSPVPQGIYSFSCCWSVFGLNTDTWWGMFSVNLFLAPPESFVFLVRPKSVCWEQERKSASINTQGK